MISKEAIRRGYNRGNYVVGAPTPPPFATGIRVAGSESLQVDPVVVPDDVVERLRSAADEVLTEIADVIDGTREWWVRTMIAETSGNPATPVAVIVKVSSADQVAGVVRIASEHGIPVTVSAGRSSVTGGALPLRGGIVLDVCGLDAIGEYDAESHIIEVEAGVFGDVLEEHLQREYGVTTGHWPSSFAISTVGGWVACRGAGQLSTRYGKIEDMVHGLDVVLPDGNGVALGNSPRAAAGPSMKDVIVGSEGTLGVITRVRLKVQTLPDYARAIAFGFGSFAEGMDACRRFLQAGATPAVVRLYDRFESGVEFGLPETNVLLVADEGHPEIVDATLSVCRQECAPTGDVLDHDRIFETWLDVRYLTGKSGDGFTKGEGFVADTLEMAGRWSVLPTVYERVLQALADVPGTLTGSAHQSHAYVDGACLYFSLRGEVAVGDRAAWYREVWDTVNAVLLDLDVALSHHHGIGMVRHPYMGQAPGIGHRLLRTIKDAVDPQGLFNPLKLGL